MSMFSIFVCLFNFHSLHLTFFSRVLFIDDSIDNNKKKQRIFLRGGRWQPIFFQVFFCFELLAIILHFLFFSFPVFFFLIQSIKINWLEIIDLNQILIIWEYVIETKKKNWIIKVMMNNDRLPMMMMMTNLLCSPLSMKWHFFFHYQ